MSSATAVHSNETESILPDVEEFSEFHPDQLSSLVDIQEELEKLQDVNIEEVMSVSEVDDVNIVDHEVTIVAEQSNVSASILPDYQEPMVQDQDINENSLNEQLMEESLEVGETITIGMPNLAEQKTYDNVSSKIEINNLNNQIPLATYPKVMPLKPAMVQPAMSVPPLKAIRPLPVPEALIARNAPFITMAQAKKNVMTRVIFSPNNEAAPDAPIIFGEAGGQAIRIIGGQNKTIITNSPKTITLAQAKEMGLISPRKIHQLNQSKGIMKKGVVVSGNKQLMVRASPTKILPLPVSGQLHPIAPSPAVNSIAGPPQKVFIRQGGTLKTGTLSGTIITTSGSSGTQSHILQLPMSQDNTNAQIHQIQLPGKPLQFVRLVNSVSTASAPPPLETITPSTISPKPISVALSTNASNTQLKMLSLPQNTPISVAQDISSFERVLVSPGLSQLSGKQDTKVSNNVVMVPAEFVKQYKPLSVTPSPSPPPVPPPPLLTPVVSKATLQSNICVPPPPITTPKAKEVPTASKDSNTNMKPKSSDPPNGIRPRKPCNCTKSQCLKLYCDCFANGEFCHECNCNCCFNNLNHEEERQRAIKACLDRNPAAFRPKIGKGYIGSERRHNKGCNCKRSGCLKNYCECYEAKIPCSNNCKCIGCRNVEDVKDIRNRTISEGSKISQQIAVKNKLSSEIQESAFKPNSFLTNQASRQPFNLMTQEVVEATCQCLLAQVEGEGQLNEHVERLIIEEFGRCLVEIIDCATRTSVNSAT